MTANVVQDAIRLRRLGTSIPSSSDVSLDVSIRGKWRPQDEREHGEYILDYQPAHGVVSRWRLNSAGLRPGATDTGRPSHNRSANCEASFTSPTNPSVSGLTATPAIHQLTMGGQGRTGGRADRTAAPPRGSALDCISAAMNGGGGKNCPR